MRFKSQIIIDSIESLIGLELSRNMLNTTKTEIARDKAKNDPKALEALNQKLESKQQKSQLRINYLRNLQNRIANNQTEESLLSLIREIEAIKVKAGFVTTPLLSTLKEEQSLLIHTKKGSPVKSQMIYSTTLDNRKKTTEFLMSIHGELNSLLRSYQISKQFNQSQFFGLPNAQAQITSPMINNFVQDATASNTENTGHNPRALTDFGRGMLLNGVNINCNPTSDEFDNGLFKTPLEKLKAKLYEFLDTDESIRNNPSAREALCNAILKNGQSLQEILIKEYLAEFHKNWPLIDRNDNQRCLPADTVPYFNWAIKDGKLIMEMELHVKTVIKPHSTTHQAPEIIDRNTGELREYDPETERRGAAPTILKYQTTITFDLVTAPGSHDEPEQNVQTLAIPRVTLYEVTLFHDQFQYKPTLTQFITEQEAPTNQSTVIATTKK